MQTPNPHYVITISRQIGSGGRQIGRILAQQLGIAYYDKDILSQAAEDSGLGPNVFDRADERKGFFRHVLGAVQPFIGGGDYYANQLSDESIFKIQSGVIRKVAAERSCVFVGRAADFILRDTTNIVSVFIAANSEDRTRRVMDEQKVDFKKALSIVEEIDEQRSGYYNFFTSGNWGNADSYDLCINSSVLGIEDTAQLILEFLHKKLGITLTDETVTSRMQ